MNRRAHRPTATLLALALAFALPVGVAAADPGDARCRVRIIHASEGKSGAAVDIDPKIDALRPYLSKAPFSTWQKFVLLEEKVLDLKARVPASFQLPNRKPAQLTFLEHVADSKPKRHRIRVQLLVGDAARPALNTTLVVPGDQVAFQVLQQPHDKGLLVLGTSCDEAKPR